RDAAAVGAVQPAVRGGLEGRAGGDRARTDSGRLAPAREGLLHGHPAATAMTMTSHTIEAQAAAFRDCFGHLKTEIGRVFVGQPDLVDQLLLCFFCQGHALIEGPPGLGKTLLVRTLADAVNLRFSRVQCTPDLMPADVTGTNILVDHGGARAFAFERGP